ncbi:Crp/Fnr family transcriptional regulator [Sphingomonas sp. CCH5-D11]|uniref:Crp/Fnr family transcriptional regulator n=1 Tax=Sphingomonas sp. CCH5-D11 TaxID=1768786 RepID=UPI00082A8CD5|nr:Crp/Fnr family transcriptional regulator [Sphingomonas sp. CCH5-D11]
MAEELIAALARDAWFDRQSPALQARLAAAGRLVSLQRGQWVYSQGDTGTGLCAVLSGALRLEVALKGERDVLIGLVRAPMILGQTQRHGGGPRIVTARANMPSRVLMITDAGLDAAAREEPDLWRRVNELVYRQLEQMTRLAAHLLVQTPAGRVALRLLQFAEEDRLTINQSDLAETTGLSRKTVNAHLAAFERMGAIERGYRLIRLRDRAALEAIVRG